MKFPSSPEFILYDIFTLYFHDQYSLYIELKIFDLLINGEKRKKYISI